LEGRGGTTFEICLSKVFEAFTVNSNQGGATDHHLQNSDNNLFYAHLNNLLLTTSNTKRFGWPLKAQLSIRQSFSLQWTDPGVELRCWKTHPGKALQTKIPCSKTLYDVSPG